MDLPGTPDCPPGCAAGTPILAPRGWVPIERLDPGTHISTVNGIHHAVRIDRHSRVPVFLVETEDGQRLRASGACLVRTRASDDPRERAWTRVDVLRAGDTVDTHLGPRRVASVSPDGAEDFYLLHEPHTRTYIAGGYICRAAGHTAPPPCAYSRGSPRGAA